ncbi:MAG: hypothetical protein AAF907_16415, partial [Planctomycetota bacterium]
QACRELGGRLHVLFHPSAAGKPAAEAREAPVRSVPGLPARVEAPAVNVVAAACTKGVPRPIKSMIAFKLRKASPHVPVCLDWNGDLGDRFGLAPGEPNAVIISAAGVAYPIDARSKGAETRIETVVEALRTRMLRSR